MEAARRTVVDEAEVAQGAPDMLIDISEASTEAYDAAENLQDAVLPSNVPTRKTPKQRRKAAKLLLEVFHIQSVFQSRIDTLLPETRPPGPAPPSALSG